MLGLPLLWYILKIYGTGMEMKIILVDFYFFIFHFDMLFGF